MNEIPTHSERIFRPQDMTPKEYRRILTDVEKGDAIRLRRGLYAYPEAIISSNVEIDKIVPDGILCLYSAWAFHGLTTQIPDAWYVAIKNKRKIRVPELLKINLIYVSEKIIDIGVEEIETLGIRNKIYDIERSVCDAIKYRNKIGMDVMAEILNSYLARENRDIKKLLEYSDLLRVRKILNYYLDIKL